MICQVHAMHQIVPPTPTITIVLTCLIQTKRLLCSLMSLFCEFEMRTIMKITGCLHHHKHANAKKQVKPTFSVCGSKPGC
mmetsp:Transcript_9097/g.15469  ORF Transcript_9097/g.15469 Transcript_9097/m.15469 type:complete len:80 (+) Transcript_9097:238-477(+)